MTNHIMIPQTQCAVLMLGPYGGGRSDIVYQLFGAEEILCSDAVRTSLGKNATDKDVLGIFKHVIAESVLKNLRVVINASLIDKSRRADILRLFPEHYHIFYIMCYKPLAECLLQYPERQHQYHRAQEQLWHSNLPIIATGDFGAATVCNYGVDDIHIEG